MLAVNFSNQFAAGKLPAFDAMVDPIRLQRRAGSSSALRPDVVTAPRDTTCEPCELCVAAMFWAKISRLYYAYSLADCENIGFDLKPLTALVRTNLHSGALKAERVLPDEARSILDEWRALPTFSGFQ